jgi:spore germination protein GerM
MIGTNIGKKIAIALAVLALVVAALYLIPRLRVKAPTEVRPVPEEMRSVTVFFGNKQADGFVSEMREVPVAQTFEDQVQAVLCELIKGAHDASKISAIPSGTELLRVFWVEDSQTLFLDFNAAFTANHPGGSTGEYFTIGTIFKTIAANFPQVVKVQFLIDGNTVESIAGHYAVDKPLEINTWR